MKKINGCLLLLGLVSVSPLFAGEACCSGGKAAQSAAATPAASVGVSAEESFAALKALAGHWKGTAKGDPDFAVEAIYRVTSGGSAVMETLAPGSEHEMVTLFHLERGALVATHYCSAGNQPRLRLVSGGKSQWVFDFDANCAVDPAKDMHIHGADIQLAEDGTLHETWIAHQDGQEVGRHIMTLRRL